MQPPPPLLYYLAYLTFNFLDNFENKYLLHTQKRIFFIVFDLFWTLQTKLLKEWGGGEFP